MTALKKVAKWAFLSVTGFILIAYFAFTAFLKWGEYRAGKQRPLHESIFARSTEPHNITLLDHGTTSLIQRLQLIESAKKTIELEFFIYELDISSRLINQALARKAKEGVSIRLLVDFAKPAFKLGPTYAQFLKRAGIKVKYYNTTALYRIITVQHRSHRKLIIVDDRKVLTGGRNIANDYFHLAEAYNFLDSDVLVEGPIVSRIRKSFDLYWNSDWASDPTPPAKSIANVKNFLTPSPADLKLKQQLQSISEQMNAKLRPQICTDLTFVTDFPGVTESNRRVFQAIAEVMKESKEEVIGESPYFVVRKGGLEILNDLASRGIKTKILTNGLYSTDAFYTISALYPQLEAMGKTKINVYAYNGTSPLNANPLSRNLSPRWGIHSKRAVIDRKTSIIGTYNVDPRSANLNSELILICRNQPELGSILANSIEARLKNSKPFLKDGRVLTKALFQDSSLKQRFYFLIALPLASTFDFLL